MDWAGVLNRIEAGEAPDTEFTLGLGDGTKVCKAMCAFANTEGGLIVLGVDDRQRIVGVKEDAEDVQERLTDLLSTGCSSPVSARLGRHEDPKGWVHWVEVARQRSFEPMRCDGRAWIRRARSTAEPSATELQELYNAFGYILTEERTIQSADASHLDVRKLRDFLAAQGLDVTDDPQPDAESDLRNCGALANTGGELRPTLYGVLALGREPQKYQQTNSFWIEGVAYEGTDRASEVLQVGEFKGTVNEQVKRAAGWFAGLGRFESYGELLRRDRRLLPSRAIREALVNAVAHRDYAIVGAKVLLEVFADPCRCDEPRFASEPHGCTARSPRRAPQSAQPAARALPAGQRLDGEARQRLAANGGGDADVQPDGTGAAARPGQSGRARPVLAGRQPLAKRLLREHAACTGQRHPDPALRQSTHEMP